MDLARTLIRSVARAFYEVEHVLIIDALILHSALRDDDLALLMGQQPKYLRKLASRLREDGLVAVHARAETREGAQRPVNRDYYFIHLHRAVDSVKFRLKAMSRSVERRFGQTPDERKDYHCPQCHAEYTQMEVLDTVGPSGFLCRRCGAPLDQAADAGRAHAGHEVQSRLNAQLAGFEDLLRQIDAAAVPENDFESALAAALPVVRDATNPAARIEAVDTRARPATVHGLKAEAERIELTLVDDSKRSRELEAAQAAERKARATAQNALPVWHTASTVTGEATPLGVAESVKREQDAAVVGGFVKGEEGDEERKEGLVDSSGLDAYFAAVKEEREREAKRAREEEGEDEEDEDEEDEDEFEDVGINGDGPPAGKRVKVDGGGGDATSIVVPAGGVDADEGGGGGGGGDGVGAGVEVSKDGDDSEEDEFEDAM